MLTYLLEDVKIEQCWAPVTMGSAAHGIYLSLKLYFGCLFAVQITQGNASGGAITLDKSPLISGIGASAGITMNRMAKNEDTATTADTFTAVAAATSLSTSATGTGSSLYLVDVKAMELGDGYPVVRLNLALSSGSNISSCLGILYGPRHAEAVDKLFTALTD